MHLFKKTIFLKSQIENRIIKQFRQDVSEQKNYSKLLFIKSIIFGTVCAFSSFGLFSYTNIVMNVLSFLLGLMAVATYLFSLTICDLIVKYLLLLKNKDIDYYYCKKNATKMFFELDSDLIDEEIEIYTKQTFNEEQIICLTEHITSGKKLDFDCFLRLEKLSTTILIDNNNHKNEQLNTFFQDYLINADTKEKMKQHLTQSFDKNLVSKELEINSELKKLL